MMLKRIDHLVMTVENIHATINFYTKILGMQLCTIKWKNIEINTLRFGDQRINLHEKGKEHQPNALNARPGTLDICFITDSPISHIVDLLKKHNIPIVKEPMVVPGTLGKMESVWFRDPDDNLIEISMYCQSSPKSSE